MTQKDMDFKKIKKLIGIMKDNDLVEIEIKQGDEKILLKRAQPPAVTAVPMAAAVPGYEPSSFQAAAEPQAGHENKDDGLIEIKSPMVGTFYATPSPDSDPFVEVGAPISPQTVVCIIEAMKVMNEIKAETTGTITDIMVTNGQAVEFGQVLFKVKPD